MSLGNGRPVQANLSGDSALHVGQLTFRPLDFSLLSHGVFEVALHESTPPRTCQLSLHYYLYKEQVDKFVWELTFAKRL